jgi:hypothetical protein
MFAGAALFLLTVASLCFQALNGWSGTENKPSLNRNAYAVGAGISSLARKEVASVGSLFRWDGVADRNLRTPTRG